MLYVGHLMILSAASTWATENNSSICTDGLLTQTVCCARSCSRCGGEKCASLPGGYSRCCEDGIVDNSKACSKSTDVACVVKSVDMMRGAGYLRDQDQSKSRIGREVEMCRRSRHPATPSISDCTYEKGPLEFEITVISTFTSERIGHVFNLVNAWKGKLVLTFYVKPGEDKNTVPESLMKEERVQIVFAYHSTDHAYFPVNDVRQMALDAVSTSHFFLIDVDLIPSYNMYSYLHCQLPQSLLSDDRVTYVVPAFETSEKDVSGTLDQCWLGVCLERGKCSQFHENNFREHGSTQYWKWWSNPDPTSKYRYQIGCILHEKFEPYVIMSTRSLHGSKIKFDGRFQGFGKNKLQFITLLRYMGYRFYVLYRTFLLHISHAKSAAQKKWNHSTRGRESCRTSTGGMRSKNDELYATVLLEYSARYGKNKHQLCNGTKVFSSCTCDCVKLIARLRQARSTLDVWGPTQPKRTQIPDQKQSPNMITDGRFN